MESGRIMGRGPDGREHVVRIFTRGSDNDERWIECLTCGYRKRAEFGARAKAEEHLSGHCSGPIQYESNPMTVVGAVIAAAFFVAVLIFMVTIAGHHP